MVTQHHIIQLVVALKPTETNVLLGVSVLFSLQTEEDYIPYPSVHEVHTEIQLQCSHFTSNMDVGVCASWLIFQDSLKITITLLGGKNDPPTSCVFYSVL